MKILPTATVLQLETCISPGMRLGDRIQSERWKNEEPGLVSDSASLKFLASIST